MGKEGTKYKTQIIIRKPIVDKCKGWEPEFDDKQKIVKMGAPDCSKIFTDDDGIKKCISYIDPSAIQRRGCALGDNRLESKKDERVILQRKFGKKRQNR